jgi:hypothetical protein
VGFADVFAHEQWCDEIINTDARFSDHSAQSRGAAEAS